MTAPAPSIYSAWKYRARITITNKVAIANYQHKLSLTWKVGMRSDFRDIRFTQQNGVNCPYWIETYTARTSAIVWIKVPSASQTILYLYFGNGAAIAASSGTNTFDFFDDFLGASLDTAKWNTPGSGTPTFANSVMTWSLASGAGENSIVSKAPVSGDGYSIRSRCRFTTSMTNHNTGISIRCNTNAKNQGIYVDSDTNIKLIETSVAAGTTIASGASTNTWYTLETTAISNTIYGRVNDGSWGSWSKAALSGNFGVHAGDYANGTHTSEYDWVLIRKYTATEPTMAITNRTVSPFYGFNRWAGAITLAAGTTYTLDPIATTVNFSSPAPSFSVKVPNITLTAAFNKAAPLALITGADIAATAAYGATVAVKFFVDLATVNLEEITIAKSVQDTLWRCSATIDDYYALSLTVRRNIIYSATDHLGVSHTLFSGIIPKSTPRLAAARNKTPLIGSDYSWYLTGQYVQSTYQHNTAATNPATVITGILGGNSWASTTGINPYNIDTVAEWGTTLNTRVFDFDKKTTKWKAIEKICDYCRYIFMVKWNTINGFVVPCAYFVSESAIDTALDLPAAVTITSPDTHLDGDIEIANDGEKIYNRVTVTGRDPDGTVFTKTLESADVTAGAELPIEYTETSGTWTTQVQVDARCLELYNFYSTPTIIYLARFKERVDLALLQKIKFVGFTGVAEDWMRITSVEYTIRGGDKTVTIQFTDDTKYKANTSMYRRSQEADEIANIESIFDGKMLQVPTNEIGTVTAIDGNTATVTLEDGRVVSARIIL